VWVWVCGCVGVCWWWCVCVCVCSHVSAVVPLLHGGHDPRHGPVARGHSVCARDARACARACVCAFVRACVHAFVRAGRHACGWVGERARAQAGGRMGGWACGSSASPIPHTLYSSRPHTPVLAAPLSSLTLSPDPNPPTFSSRSIRRATAPTAACSVASAAAGSGPGGSVSAASRPAAAVSAGDRCSSSFFRPVLSRPCMRIARPGCQNRRVVGLAHGAGAAAQQELCCALAALRRKLRARCCDAVRCRSDAAGLYSCAFFGAARAVRAINHVMNSRILRPIKLQRSVLSGRPTAAARGNLVAHETQ
jgi:hypothetical protein